MSTAPDFDALWDYQDPAATATVFRALLEAPGAPRDGAYRAELLTQLARTHSLRRETEAAEKILNEVARSLTPEMIRPRVRYLLELGRTLNSSGRREASRTLFLEAWHLAREIEAEFHAVDALHMLAIVSAPTDQVSWSAKAIEAARAARDPRARDWLGPLSNNLAWTYHDRGDFQRALEHFHDALSFWTEKGRQPQLRIAQWSVARALRSLGRTEEALAIQMRILQSGEADGFAAEEAGECLLALGRPEEAARHFAKAATELGRDPWLTKEQPDRIARLLRLGGEHC